MLNSGAVVYALNRGNLKMAKHFKLRKDLSIEWEGRTLYRIEATKDIDYQEVHKGDLGGFVESKDNLGEDAWVFGDAKVFDSAKVFGNAKVSNGAEVYGTACVFGSAKVFGDTRVFGNAHVSGDAVISSDKDYIVFKNFWSSGRYFTWTRSNNMWRAGCFYGTGEELVEKAYRDSEESGDNYKAVVDYVNNVVLKQGGETTK